MKRCATFLVAQRGFSLVEVTLALGVFAICIVSIIYLLGTALDSVDASQTESALVGVLRNVDSEVRCLPLSANDPSLPSLTALENHVLYFDNRGNRVSSEEFAFFRVEFKRITDVSELTQVEYQEEQSPGIRDSGSHFLWRATVSYPTPGYQKSASFLLGRTLMGSDLASHRE